ncbi:hypothetical protein [Actinocorallia libanotica]|uniref:Uncharacterized protein n=1 Tax=Actinocorallia libanotica TaxID=46162 RepID=A0ABN1QRM4_9ACTN
MNPLHPYAPPAARSLNPIAGWLTAAIGATMLLDLVLISGFSSAADDEPSTDGLLGLQPVVVMFNLLSVAGNLLWMGTLLRARQNIENRFPGRLRWSREMLIAAFLVPLGLMLVQGQALLPPLLGLTVDLALYVALILIVQELWRQSRPGGPGPHSVLVFCWGALGTALTLSSVMASMSLAGAPADDAVFAETGFSADRFAEAFRAVAMVHGLDLVFSVVAIAMVWRFTVLHHAGMRAVESSSGEGRLS